ncbi:RNA-binding (RRM/RBD/RNP motifs) family protein [Thalictrum thalictroides]|uniref:RNA-binding (RRM/RBD/RNP motifs) family protein n=1 Tax=Thalictrum thalictroides TaxID=46969 RepID=A0A7J6WIT5_THATH|nr:RNA-binding (RRM/RBD/RNP motifs) family protein [Thalictrum thalictroides]
MSSTDEKYVEFQEKMKRTVYVYDLSPKVNNSVIRTALGQFGDVINIHIIPNYTENISQCALVEMGTAKQAKCIIAEMTNYPFMMSGMPRPVRASAAQEDMFVDRPRKPGRKLQCRLVGPNDPDFEKATKLKELALKHHAEASFLHKAVLEEEQKLARKQGDALDTNYGKYEQIENVFGDGTLGRFARRMGVRLADD